MEIQFGDCVLDLSGRQLHRRGETVRLSPKAYDLLELLISCRPRAFSKSELMRRLWPRTVVVEANLSNLMAEVRAALGDNPRQPRFIRTVYGFGYAFCGATGGETTEPRSSHDSLCWVICGESRIQLTDGEHLIGRHPASIVPIDSGTVSRHHAAIRVAGDEATLMDLGSRNGTFVCGHKIASEVTLKNGDEIRVGPVVLGFEVASLGSTTDADIQVRREEPGG
jgi:DNA-binding winged helix-turn-helix (wHTH) protein